MARVNHPVLTPVEVRNPDRLGHGFFEIMNGRINVGLDVTLSAGTETVIDTPLILEQSVILVAPGDAAAAALAASGFIYSDIALQVNGQCTLKHPTAAGTEVARVLVIG